MQEESCKMSAGHTGIITIVMVDRILWSTISIRVFLLYTSPPAYSQNTVSSSILFYHPLLSLSFSPFFPVFAFFFRYRGRLALLSASHCILFWLIIPNPMDHVRIRRKEEKETHTLQLISFTNFFFNGIRILSFVYKQHRSNTLNQLILTDVREKKWRKKYDILLSDHDD